MRIEKKKGFTRTPKFGVSSQGERGFTLIELLVVISIISVLSSIILASLNSARIKARDAQRKIATEEIAKAMYLYYDNTGSFPPAPDSSRGLGLDWSAGLKAVMAPYIGTLPKDPLNDSNHLYIYQIYDPAMFPSPGDGSCTGHYLIWFILENSDDATGGTTCGLPPEWGFRFMDVGKP